MAGCTFRTYPWEDPGMGYVGFRFASGAGYQYGRYAFGRLGGHRMLSECLTMLTPTPVNGSQPVKHQVVNKRPTKVLSAGLRSVPQASWHGGRVGPSRTLIGHCH